MLLFTAHFLRAPATWQFAALSHFVGFCHLKASSPQKTVCPWQKLDDIWIKGSFEHKASRQVGGTDFLSREHSLEELHLDPLKKNMTMTMPKVAILASTYRISSPISQAIFSVFVTKIWLIFHGKRGSAYSWGFGFQNKYNCWITLPSRL